MNLWSQKTLELARTGNYLDKLQFIYPHSAGVDRNISADKIQEISTAFNNRNENELLNKLLDLDKFPYKDSYVAFLRKDRNAILRNPQTAKRIIDRLYSMGWENVLEGINEPKEANTQRGNSFKTWTFNNFETASLQEFKNSNTGILILNESEAESLSFCINELRVMFKKRPDLVAKVNRTYIVGEAKFSSDSGGNQNAAFEDGINLVSNVSGNAQKLFLLDGPIWLPSRGAQATSITHSTANIFSATLLSEFFNSLL